MPRRSVIVTRTIDPAHADEGLPPLGSVEDVLLTLANYNTAPESLTRTNNALGVLTLHGPGFRVEVPTTGEDVRQFMVTMTDEDFAFPVLTRLCRANKWTMMDPDSGQRLRF